MAGIGHRVRARTLAAVGASAATVVMTGLLAAPATAASGIWVQVNPSTITAGLQVTITGSCGENTNPQQVTSAAFTSPVTMLPNNGNLQATVVIPATKPPQGYTVTLRCASGNTATTTLWVVSMATPTLGPATGGGGTATTGSGRMMLGGGLGALLAAGGLGAAAAVRRRRVPSRT